MFLLCHVIFIALCIFVIVHAAGAAVVVVVIVVVIAVVVVVVAFFANEASQRKQLTSKPMEAASVGFRKKQFSCKKKVANFVELLRQQKSIHTLSNGFVTSSLKQLC